MQNTKYNKMKYRTLYEKHFLSYLQAPSTYLYHLTGSNDRSHIRLYISEKKNVDASEFFKMS